MLKSAGFENVYNLSGGYISLERHARAAGSQHLQIGLMPVERKSVEDLDNARATGRGAAGATSAAEDNSAASEQSDGPLVIDVRTPMEFAMGAYPGSLNIALDELPERVSELGEKDREIILYCASGARSAYGVRLMTQLGYSNVRNGGSLHDVMAMAQG
jgi:rhodanese-related sulfurtransferase